MSKTISVKEALSQILQTITPVEVEKVNILDALGRFLGTDIYAQQDIPPVNNSAMDGYALVSEDTSGASNIHPLIFDIIEHIPAGYFPQKIVGFADAARIMTGAPVPEGADTIVKLEDAESTGDQVKIFAEIPAGQNIRFAGEDIRKSELVLAQGRMLKAADIGMLAALGIASVPVYRKPRVAIIATGDELVDIGGLPAPEKIISSNSYSLSAQTMECGGLPLNIGIARDTKDDIIAHFRAALRSDIIISSGGVSVGDYDFVKVAMEEVGITLHFRQVAERPGRPMTFGTTADGIPVFGLPGNPVSAMITFEQYVRPVILKMMGQTVLFRKTVRAVLKERIEKKAGLTYFLRAQIARENGRFTASTTGEQGSGILKSMVLANGLIVLPEDVTVLQEGEEVKVQILDNSLDLSGDPEYL